MKLMHLTRTLLLLLALTGFGCVAADAPTMRVATPTRGDVHRFVVQRSEEHTSELQSH